MSNINQILSALRNLLHSLFGNDMEVMSPEFKQILSVPEDGKRYAEAVDRLIDGSKEETIRLSTGEEITIMFL